MISYKKGYKYQLAETYSVTTDVVSLRPIMTEYIRLFDNRLIVEKGYAWDGPSGPTIDTPNFMRGSLVHDALYQLMREGLLGPEWRKQADMELRRICLEDGMSRLRAWWVYRGVRLGAGFAANPVNRKPILKAPHHSMEENGV